MSRTKAGRLQDRDGAVEVGADRDQVVEGDDAVGMRRCRRRRRPLRARRRQAVEIGGLDLAQGPAGHSAARVRARQPDPHLADDTGVALDLEPERRPGLGPVGDGELVEHCGHARTVATADRVA